MPSYIGLRVYEQKGYKCLKTGALKGFSSSEKNK